MSSNNLQASLLIKAGVEGLQSIDALAKSIEAAGLDVSGLTGESAKLAKQFAEIEQKQGLINQFRELKKATNDATSEWQHAQNTTKTLAQSWGDAEQKVASLQQAITSQGSATKEQAADLKAAEKEVKALAAAHAESVAKTSQLKGPYEEFNARLGSTRTAMHDVGLATTGLNAQQKALQQESAAATKSMNDLTAEAHKLQQIAQAKIKLGIDTDDKARAQIAEVTAAYEELKKSGTLSSKELAQASQAHKERVDELEQSLKATGPTLETLTAEFGKVTAAAGGLAYVAKAAMEFETAMAGVKKMVDGTPEQIEELSKKIQQMSVNLGMTSGAVAEIAAAGGGLGVPIEKIALFTEMAGKMATAFDMTAEKAGDSAAKLANVFGIPVLQVGALGDAINVLGNTTAAKEHEIVDAILRIGGNARQFGLAGEQAAALAAAMISLGKTPEVAATAINALLTKLQTANVQSDDFQNTLKGIGLNADQMAKDIAANPQQALNNFLKTLEGMDKQQRSVATFKLFGQDYVDDVNALVGSLGSYDKALESVKDKTKTAGAMQKEFDAKMSTSAQSIEQVKSSVAVMAQNVGTLLLPALSMTAKVVGGLTQGLTHFADAHPHLTQIAVLVASAQVAMVAFSSAMTLAGAVGIKTSAGIVSGFTAGAGSVNLVTVGMEHLLLATLPVAQATVAAAAGLSKMSLQGLSVDNAASSAVSGLKGMASHMMTLNGLFMAAAGWTIGTGIGESLYKSSSAVRAFGDELARVGAFYTSLLTTGSLKEYNANFETSAEAVIKAAEAEKKHANSIEGKAQAMVKADQAAKQQQLNYKELDESTKKMIETISSLTAQQIALKDSGKENSAEYKALGTELAASKEKLLTLNAAQDKTVLSAEEQTAANKKMANSYTLTKNSLEMLVQQQAKLETEGKKGTTEFNNLGTQIDQTKNKLALLKAEVEKRGIGELIKTSLDKASEAFEALNLDQDEFASGISTKTQAALTAFVTVAHLAEGDVRKLAVACNAARDAAGDSKEAQDDLNAKLLQVAGGNAALAASIKDTAEVQKAAKANTQQYSEAMQALGVNTNTVFNRVSATFTQNGAAIDELGARLKQTGVTGAQSANALYTAWSGFLKTASSQAEVDMARAKLVEMGNAGKLSTGQVEQGMIAIKNQANQVANSIDPVAQAFERLGIKSKETLKLAAQQQLRDLETVKQSGQATQDALKHAAESTLSAAMASGDAVTIAQAKAQAAASGLSVAVDATGKATVKTFAEMNAAAENHASTVKSTVGGAYQQMGDEAKAAAQEANDSWNAVLNKRLKSEASDKASHGSDGVTVQTLSLEYIKGLLQRKGADSDKIDMYARNIMQQALEKDQGLAQTTTGVTREWWSAFLKKGEASLNQVDFIDEATAHAAHEGYGSMGNNGKVADDVKKAADETKTVTAEVKKTADEEKVYLQRELELQKQANDQLAQKLEQQKQTASIRPEQPPTPNDPLQSGNDVGVIRSAQLVADEIRKIREDTIKDFMKTLQDELKRTAR